MKSKLIASETIDSRIPKKRVQVGTIHNMADVIHFQVETRGVSRFYGKDLELIVISKTRNDSDEISYILDIQGRPGWRVATHHPNLEEMLETRFIQGDGMFWLVPVAHNRQEAIAYLKQEVAQLGRIDFILEQPGLPKIRISSSHNEHDGYLTGYCLEITREDGYSITHTAGAIEGLLSEIGLN